MRIHILSDLHVDLAPFILPRVKADVTVLAGDVRQGKSALDWICDNCPEHPVIYVLGNHEFYGNAVPKLIEDLRRMSVGTNVHVLENESFSIDDVRFLGCTLWTDFRLFGDPSVAGREAAKVMNDYYRIRVSPEFRRLTCRDTAGFHARSRAWLQQQLVPDAGVQTVIVTHHAPSARSLAPIYAGDLISAAFASSLDGLVAATQARLWIHGHTHHRADYSIGETRVIANPRGYASIPESTGFDPELVVEV